MRSLALLLSALTAFAATVELWPQQRPTPGDTAVAQTAHTARRAGDRGPAAAGPPAAPVQEQRARVVASDLALAAERARLRALGEPRPAATPEPGPASGAVAGEMTGVDEPTTASVPDEPASHDHNHDHESNTEPAPPPADETVSTPVDETASAPSEPPAATRNVWDDLADCESGEWDRDAQPIEGSARWHYGTQPGEDSIYEGGLHFHPGTWDAYRDADMPDHAGHAARGQQIVVGQRVLGEQGWGAWPVCSYKIGAR